MNVTQDEEDVPPKEGNVEENEEEGNALSQNARQSSSGTEEDGPLEFESANEASNIVEAQNEEIGEFNIICIKMFPMINQEDLEDRNPEEK